MFARRNTFLANNCRHLLKNTYENYKTINIYNNNNNKKSYYLLSRVQCQPVLHQQQNTTTATAITLKRTLVSGIWNKLFGKYLLATNIISSGVLMVIGDVAAQEIELRRHHIALIENPAIIASILDRYDKQRLWRMFIVGSLQGPLHHYVYQWMDILMPVANVRNSIKKILVDQLIMSPLCILIFFYSACALENKCLKDTNDELINKFPIIYLMDWLVWPGAQYINFRYLETKYRVIFVNVCTAIYDVFLSYMKHEYVPN